MEEDADKIEKTVMTERSTKEIAEYNRQITSEKNKILKIFKDCNADVKKIAGPLIDNASYMKVELAHLKKYNIKNGIKEFYMNGKGQFGFKESVESKTYNTMIKNYMNVIKQLNEMLPKGKSIGIEDDGFEDF
ncbi:MAG TPA: hypothetical protein H9829_01370 [Candidatus Tetragenococcus pullicola]|nr:hypothetical protein [Candidatus Tetragenococcus pullicola]